MTEEKRPLRVAIWSAVSSRKQAEPDKVSLEEQERLGREFAESIGGQVVATYVVPGHTRDLVFYADAEREMDTYRRLREDVEAGRFDELYCLDVDRLGRDPALIQTVISMVEKSGAEVYSAANPHPVGQRSYGQRIVDAFQMVRAGEEQRIRTRRAGVGMRHRVQRGLFATHLPTGYRPIRDLRGRTVGAEFDEQIGAVRLCTDLYLHGDSWNEIKAALDGSPYKPPQASDSEWSAITLRQWMQNDAYAGYTTWGDARPDEPSDRYPALWNQETYQAILRERERRRKYKPRADGTMYLGIVFCARCGSRMHRSSSGASGTRYLRCGKHAKGLSHNGSELCHPNHIPEATISAALVEWLIGITDLDALNEEMIKDEGPDGSQWRIAEIDALLSDYEQQRKRLALAFAAGKMQADMYAETDGEILDRVAALQTERMRLQGKQIRAVPLPRRFESVGEARALLERNLENLPAQRVNVLLHTIGIRILVEDRQIVSIGVYESV